MRNKNILVITRNFPPLVGGMETLALNVYRQLKQHNNCDVVGPTGCEEFTSKPSKCFTSPASPVFKFLVQASLKSCYAVIRNKYDLIICCSGVTAVIAVWLNKIVSCPVVTLVHGLDLLADNYIYQKFFVPAIIKSDLIIANSANTKSIAIGKGIPSENIVIVNPGVDIAIPEIGTENDFKAQYELTNVKILLSVGRIIPRKGVNEFISRVLPNVIKRIPGLVYIVIGGSAVDALDKNNTAVEEIYNSIDELQLHKHVKLLGHVDSEILLSAYTQSDLFIFPVIDLPNDVEGFGMVAIEAAANGLPTIAFAAGGVPDAVSHGRSGILVSPGNYQEMATTIINYLKGNTGNITKTTCIEHTHKFSWQNYGKNLIQAIDKRLD